MTISNQNHPFPLGETKLIFVQVAKTYVLEDLQYLEKNGYS